MAFVSQQFISLPEGGLALLKRNRILIALVLLVVLAAGVWNLVDSPTRAQNSSDSAEVRIAARKLDDGRVEFALQQRTGSEWSERILPRARKLPANPGVDRWLTSSPVRLSGLVGLPITTADWYYHQAEDLTFGAGRADYTGRSRFETTVVIGGIVNYDNIEKPVLSFNCYGSWGPNSGGFSAQVNVPWRERSGSDIVFVAKRYETDATGHWLIDQVVDELTWNYDPSSNIFFWEITQDQMLNIKGFHTLTVAYHDPNDNVIVAVFDVEQALGTPVQPNLDHCGEYHISEYEAAIPVYDDGH